MKMDMETVVAVEKLTKDRDLRRGFALAVEMRAEAEKLPVRRVRLPTADEQIPRSWPRLGREQELNFDL